MASRSEPARQRGGAAQRDRDRAAPGQAAVQPRLQERVPRRRDRAQHGQDHQLGHRPRREQEARVEQPGRDRAGPQHGHVRHPVQDGHQGRVPGQRRTEPDRDGQRRDRGRQMRHVDQVQREKPGQHVDQQVGDHGYQDPADRGPVPQRGQDLPRPRRPRRAGPRIAAGPPITAGARRGARRPGFAPAGAEPRDGGQRGQHQVGHPPAAPGGQHRREQQRPGDRSRRTGQVPAGHDLSLPVRPGVHQLGLGQRHERSRGREEHRERGQQHDEGPRPGHREQAQDEDHAAAEHGEPAPPSLAGQDAQRKLERSAGQQRHRGEQPDLRVAQAQVVTDQRQRGALGPVNQLVGQFDRERDRQGGKSRLSASSEAHGVHATPKRRSGPDPDGVSGGGSRPARPGAARTSRRRWRPP